jgi:hypothetical protein
MQRVVYSASAEFCPISLQTWFFPYLARNSCLNSYLTPNFNPSPYVALSFGLSPTL